MPSPAKVAVLISSVLFAVHLSYVSTVVNPGIPGIFCPAPGQEMALANCSRDCKYGHNSLTGVCGNASASDYTCYCGPPLTTPIQLNRSGQCLDETGPNRAVWDDVCRQDCRCTHGAIEGRCNFETRGCDCLGSSEGTGLYLCPFNNTQEIKDWFNTSYHAVGMGDFADAVLNGTYSGGDDDYIEYTYDDM